MEDKYRVAIITLSDKGFEGKREDLSGPAIEEYLDQSAFLVTDRKMLPDDRQMIEKELIRLCDEAKVDLILTTGGTGFSMRDVTPEATMAVAHRNAPGIAEAIRAMSLKVTKRAMLSRAVSVIRGKTLIINLPGSPKAVRECMEFIMDTIVHGMDILTGRDRECGGGYAHR